MTLSWPRTTSGGSLSSSAPVAAGHLRSAGGRPSRRRGFTIVEMVVVMVMMALLVAFVLPRLIGTSTFAEDQRAQATASGALDTVLRSFLEEGKQGRVAPSTAGTCAGADLTSVATNCLVFADPTALGALNGDVRFTGATNASTAAGTASVATLKTGGSWRVGIAVLSPQTGGGSGTVSSCWMVWRNFPITGAPVGNGKTDRDPLERYFVSTSLAAGDATSCTGTTALAHEWDSFCQSPPSGEAALGTSWRRPCPDYSS